MRAKSCCLLRLLAPAFDNVGRLRQARPDSHRYRSQHLSQRKTWAGVESSVAYPGQKMYPRAKRRLEAICNSVLSFTFSKCGCLLLTHRTNYRIMQISRVLASSGAW